MADLDFLDGFDSGGDWGFTSVSEKPSDTAKKTETVVKETAEGTAKAVSGELVSRLESKLDKIYSEIRLFKTPFPSTFDFFKLLKAVASSLKC